ncbi:MAG: tyrosine-type recombinase/integrase [Hyphomicrobiaceae bacterium]
MSAPIGNTKASLVVHGELRVAPDGLGSDVMPCGTADDALAPLVDKARRYVRASRAGSTLGAYQRHFKAFAAWCHAHGRVPAPADADTMTLFLAEMASRYRPSSLTAFVSAIAFAHRDAGHAFDRTSIETLMAGIRRTHGTAERRMAAITTAELRRIVVALPDTLQGVRDRALLLVGFAAALRRSELVGLDIGERATDGSGLVVIGEEGARVTLFKSKTDQEGGGFIKGIVRGTAPCPVAALEAWLTASGIEHGAIFRPIDKASRVGASRLTDRSIADIVKRVSRRAVLAAGGSEAEAAARASAVAGHSLRAGFATSAAAASVTGENIARHVGWSSTQMTARYVREAELFKNNPLHKVLGD